MSAVFPNEHGGVWEVNGFPSQYRGKFFRTEIRVVTEALDLMCTDEEKSKSDYNMCDVALIANVSRSMSKAKLALLLQCTNLWGLECLYDRKLMAKFVHLCNIGELMSKKITAYISPIFSFDHPFMGKLL